MKGTPGWMGHDPRSRGGTRTVGSAATGIVLDGPPRWSEGTTDRYALRDVYPAGRRCEFIAARFGTDGPVSELATAVRCSLPRPTADSMAMATSTVRFLAWRRAWAWRPRRPPCRRRCRLRHRCRSGRSGGVAGEVSCSRQKCLGAVRCWIFRADLVGLALATDWLSRRQTRGRGCCWGTACLPRRPRTWCMRPLVSVLAVTPQSIRPRWRLPRKRRPGRVGRGAAGTGVFVSGLVRRG